MPTPLTIDTARNDGGQLVLIATGEIDMSNLDTFHEALESATGSTTGETVTVDLSAVEYLDSGAINALVTHADSIRVIANPLLMSALTVSGLGELVALESAPPPQQR